MQVGGNWKDKCSRCGEEYMPSVEFHTCAKEGKKIMDAHNDLLEQARKAITDVFSDHTVGSDKTRESLEELKDEINTFLDALEVDNDFFESFELEED